MRERHRFRPSTVEGLEMRAVLSGGSLIMPAATGKLTISARTNPTLQVADQVNQTFDSFETDYLQAQGAYLANGTSTAEVAFRKYVSQRVELLATQLTRIFAHVPGALSRSQTSSPGGPVVVQSFLRTRINGLASTNLIVALLGRRNIGGAVPPAGTSGTTATLYTDQAISAIETARTATLNSVGFLFSRSFKHT
jgi:hypothetical protein